jgi:hypothetical protein
MRIYGIAVSEELLAGADLTGFLGFFDERYRVHDYDRGRMVARMVLTDPVMSEAGELGPIRYTPKHTNPIDSTLNGLQLGQLSIEEQQAFREGVKKRVGEMVRYLIWILVLSSGRRGDRSADECDSESFVSGVTYLRRSAGRCGKEVSR